MISGGDKKAPGGPQDADPEKGQQGRRQGIAHAAQGAEEDLDRYVEQIKGHEEAHHAHADFDDLGIRDEEALQGLCKNVDPRDDKAQDDKHHDGAVPDALHDPVPLAGPDILADEGRDGDAEGPDDHPEDGVDLAVGGIGGDGIGPEGVDGGHQDHIGQGVHDLGESQRKSHPEDPAGYIARNGSSGD